MDRDGKYQDVEHDEQIGGVHGVRRGVQTHLAAKVSCQQQTAGWPDVSEGERKGCCGQLYFFFV